MLIEISTGWDHQPVDPALIHRIEVFHTRGSGMRVAIDAPKFDTPAPKAPAGRLWRLWEHDVVELFFAGSDGRYTELEFGPHGHYLALELSGPRQIISSEAKLTYTVETGAQRWRARAAIPQALVPTQIATYNAFAIFGPHPHRVHLVHHPLPGPHPDFHQPDHFRRWPGFSAQ